MGWLFWVAYIAVGVWSTRIMLRWVGEKWPEMELEGGDLVCAILSAVIWPVGVPSAYFSLGKFPEFPKFHLDSRLRKFAGLPPRKEH